MTLIQLFSNSVDCFISDFPTVGREEEIHSSVQLIFLLHDRHLDRIIVSNVVLLDMCKRLTLMLLNGANRPA